ncbi:MAG: serine/threonine protein phosphatase, partial [Phycisphaerae bacterium]|nr:serine/threonine protein phosphatase [Phycisphaerae bacterium]
VTTHMYLGELERHKTPQETRDAPKGVMQWKKVHGKRGNTSRQMWDKCFKKHANLRLIFCGDQSRCQAIHLTQQGDHGNTVHSLLSDYGTGPLRIYRFLPSENKIEVITYDTTRKQPRNGTGTCPKCEEHQFTIEMELAPRASAGS